MAGFLVGKDKKYSPSGPAVAFQVALKGGDSNVPLLIQRDVMSRSLYIPGRASNRLLMQLP